MDVLSWWPRWLETADLIPIQARFNALRALQSCRDARALAALQHLETLQQQAVDQADANHIEELQAKLHVWPLGPRPS